MSIALNDRIHNKPANIQIKDLKNIYTVTSHFNPIFKSKNT